MLHSCLWLPEFPLTRRGILDFQNVYRFILSTSHCTPHMWQISSIGPLCQGGQKPPTSALVCVFQLVTLILPVLPIPPPLTVPISHASLAFGLPDLLSTQTSPSSVDEVVLIRIWLHLVRLPALNAETPGDYPMSQGRRNLAESSDSKYRVSGQWFFPLLS